MVEMADKFENGYSELDMDWIHPWIGLGWIGLGPNFLNKIWIGLDWVVSFWPRFITLFCRTNTATELVLYLALSFWPNDILYI